MVDNGAVVQFLKKKDYEMINNNLGSGSFGKTVLLKDPFIDELFVSKKYDPEFSEDKQDFYDNFLQEIKILYKLNHRNVVRVYNYYAYPDIFTGYILMEYIDGEDIRSYFDNYLPWLGGTSPNEIFTQLIDGFSYIESQGIVHRDIREGNIMVDRSGTAKIIDFGLGKTFKPIGDASKDSLRSIINRSGLDLLPNEYIEGRYTSKTDMFYLGELFNRLLRETGNAGGFSYTDITNRMMEPDETGRYSSFSEIKDILERHRFSVLDISEKDKEIYQKFAHGIYGTMAYHTSKDKEYVESIEEFAERLRVVVEKNCFETIVRNNADVIMTVLKSGFRYFEHREIKQDAIKEFYTWFLALPDDVKSIVLNNIIAGIATIKTEIEDDLPF